MTEHISTYEKNGVIVIRSNHTKILNHDVVVAIADEIIDLMKAQPDKNFCFSFQAVEFMSSEFLAPLITFKKLTSDASRQIRLCKIRREVYEVFAMTRLDKLFDIRDDEDDAIASLQI